MKAMKLLGLAVIGAGMLPAAAQADITLTHRNSVVHFGQDGAGTVTGMRDWFVDGTDHLFQQWFWFRVDGDDNETSLNNLTQTVTDQSSRLLIMEHVGNGFMIETAYLLTGGSTGSHTSDVAETITIFNTGQSALDITFFQYSDFDLNGTPIDSGVSLINVNKWRQTDVGGSIAMTEATAIPDPSHAEADVFANTLNKLNDGDVDDLNDVTSLSGPADYTWAWQWDFTINPGMSVQISKDKQIKPIPAPGAIGLAMVGFGAVGWVKRRFKGQA